MTTYHRIPTDGLPPKEYDCKRCGDHCPAPYTTFRHSKPWPYARAEESDLCVHCYCDVSGLHEYMAELAEQDRLDHLESEERTEEEYWHRDREWECPW